MVFTAFYNPFTKIYKLIRVPNCIPVIIEEGILQFWNFLINLINILHTLQNIIHAHYIGDAQKNSRTFQFISQIY